VNKKTSEVKVLHISAAHDLGKVINLLLTEGQVYGAIAMGIGYTLTLTAAAIANAIYNAVGVRIKELPITPEKVLAALEEKKKKVKS